MLIEPLLVTADQGGDDVSEIGPTGHPLEIATTTMAIRAIEAAAREPPHEPPEYRLVTNMHS